MAKPRTARPARPGEAAERLELEAYREFVTLAELGQPVALVTVTGTTGSAPRGMGAAMAVRADGSIVGTVGGGNLEMLAVQEALAALADGRGRTLHYDYSRGPKQNLEKACVGTTDLYVQPSPAPARVVIFGAGHIGIALAPMAQAAGFRVTVADERPGYPDPSRFPAGVQLAHGPLVPFAESLAIDDQTYLVLVNYGHVQDEEVLLACLHRPWRYLGLIGSKAKVSRMFGGIAKRDRAARARLAAVHAPIGLDLGGRSPGEIALSIAAELLAVRHARAVARPRP